MKGVWETDYRHDRRKHRHRCRACGRILTEGERALFVRLGRKTYVVHAEPPRAAPGAIACADRVVEPKDSAATWRERFHEWREEKTR